MMQPKDLDITIPIEKLENERAQVLSELQHLRRLAQAEIDPDVGEGDPKLVERDLMMSLIRVQEQKLANIDQALQGMREGTYGICEHCGQPIDPERLEALPETTLCINCKTILERRGHF